MLGDLCLCSNPMLTFLLQCRHDASSAEVQTRGVFSEPSLPL